MHRVSERLRCFICGDETTGAVDYVEVAISVEEGDAQQFFGAHANHLESVMADGFSIEVP